MQAMAMSIHVRDAQELEGLAPGTAVEFQLVLEGQNAYGKNIKIRRYQSVEQDPLNASRLRLLNRLTGPSRPKPLSLGQTVPDFSIALALTDRLVGSKHICAVKGSRLQYKAAAGWVGTRSVSRSKVLFVQFCSSGESFFVDLLHGEDLAIIALSDNIRLSPAAGNVLYRECSHPKGKHRVRC